MQVLPELNGKLTGMAFRVPTPNVSGALRLWLKEGIGLGLRLLLCAPTSVHPCMHVAAVLQSCIGWWVVPTT